MGGGLSLWRRKRQESVCGEVVVGAGLVGGGARTLGFAFEPQAEQLHWDLRKPPLNEPPRQLGRLLEWGLAPRECKARRQRRRRRWAALPYA